MKPLKGFLQYIVESRNISIAVSPKTLTDQITSRTSIVPLLIELEEFRRAALRLILFDLMVDT
ncbi:MAG: hypothetical protein MK447_11505 [SAR324 cluster bacterium]|nr:hypothetical protein [SAR324 cluster bacterium]